ncbi:MAG: preprotein translocase subunit SecE [Clostridiales bacterium]|nr:preprotein translocase subunit SecE [Clostridiales bacterium]
MGDSANTTDKAPKQNFIKGLKAEFHKIIWPTKDDVAKKTGAVVSASVVLGLIIALLDMIIKYGFDKIL